MVILGSLQSALADNAVRMYFNQCKFLKIRYIFGTLFYRGNFANAERPHCACSVTLFIWTVYHNRLLVCICSATLVSIASMSLL